MEQGEALRLQFPSCRITDVTLKGSLKMKKTLIALAVLAASFGASAQSSFPGSNWSELTVNPSVVRGTPEDNNVLLQGNVEQGMIVTTLAKGWRVNTFAGLNYSIDRNALAYNNKLVPMVGVKLQHDFDGGVVDLGVRLVHENHFRGVTAGPSSGTGVQAYVSYWTGWNLKK